MRKVLEAESNYPTHLELVNLEKVPPDASERFFRIQEEIEADLQRGGMNYFRFSRQLWEAFLGGEPDVESPEYKEFEAIVVVGLQRFTTKGLIYPEIEADLSSVLEQVYPQVERLALWSRGDTTHTGYQLSKLTLSGLQNKWLRALISKFGRTEAKKLIQEKTSILIGEEKNLALEKMIQEPGVVKLLVVEDSLNNLATTRELARKHGLPHTGLWAAYSREGKKILGTQKYQEAEAQWTVLHSPAELVSCALDSDLQNATVVIDFDGVLGNNVWMREQQSRVFWTAINRVRR